MPEVSTRLEQLELDVGLQRPGREGQVADLAGERPAELLPGEDPLQLALRGLGQVGAPGSSRKMMSTLSGTPGVVRIMTPPALALRGLQPGDRQRLALEVDGRRWRWRSARRSPRA